MELYFKNSISLLHISYQMLRTNSNKLLTGAAIVLFVVFYTSCKKEKDPLDQYGSIVKAVMRNDAGAFRGLNFGEKMDSVIARETSPATEADQGYLYYEYKIDSTGSFNITYDFDENGLSEIQSDVFVNSAVQTDSVFNAFKRYFDDHFGKNETDMGYNVWSVKSDKFGDIKINLTDESTDLTADQAPGKISVWIYPDKE